MTDFHPLVKQLLDGELTLAELPAELRAEGEEALRLLGAVERQPVTLPRMTDRVMRAIEGRTPRRSLWRRVAEPREISVRIRPWLLAPALAAAAALALWVGRDRPALPTQTASAPLITVRFMLVAPEAKNVSIAGTFNGWDTQATPLVRTGSGVWAATLSLPAGQHQYAFVVDGARWVPDPAAPAVDDGFGRRNSVLAL
jgi:hypothetical protein